MKVELTKEQLQVIFNGLDLLQHRIARPVVDALISQLNKKAEEEVESSNE